MSERQRIFIARMKVRPEDRVLEVGCGHGIAASLICELLVKGRYTAIDRSQKMIDAAKRRNAQSVTNGRAEFLLGDLRTIDLGSRSFDKIFAQRVRLFHDEPDVAHALVKRWLAPRGKVFVEYDEPE
jgi:ubiquinone/menaquinone biosynthesis C-methylase UbiE